MNVTAQNNHIIATKGTAVQSKIQNPESKIRHGFTMIELLVVIALLAVLLTLIFKPLIDTFNLTSRAGTQVEAQAAARDSLREVTTTLSDAAYIYDNSSNPINLWVPTVGGQTPVPTAYAMAEYVRPSRQYDQSPNLPSDPTTGDPIYSQADAATKKGYALPLTAGRTLGRLFIGLADNTPTATTIVDSNGVTLNGMPAKPYFNTYEEPRVNNKDNRYTLYRAEVQTFIADPNTAAGANPVYIPNLKLFHTVNASGAIVDTDKGTVQLHDPNFFYDHSPAGGQEDGAGTALWAVPGAKPTGNNGAVYTIADNWRAVSSTLLLPKKVDAIALNRNPDTNAVLYYDANGNVGTANGYASRVRPLITFAPYYVQNDPGTPSSVENAGNEAIAPAAVSYITQYSHWDNPFRVQVFRAFDAATGNPDPTGDPLAQATLNYYEYDPATGNILYKTAAAGGAGGAGVVSGPIVDPATGAWTGPSAVNGALKYSDPNFFVYAVDPRAGAVNFSFPWSVLCHDTQANNYAPVPQTYSPLEINDKVINIATSGYGKRYVQLGVISNQMWNAKTLMPAGAQSPLDPMIFGTVPGTTPRVTIVPGSERVFGPDQNPGPHYGYRTQYTRVSANGDAPGPNQYKINYTDIPNAALAIANDPLKSDPRVGAGYIEFDSGNDTETSPDLSQNPKNMEQTVPNAAGGFPLTYRPHSLPLLKNVAGANAASDPIEITYRFQMNRTNDVVKADYLTRELMNVSMNIRYYDPRSSRPQEMNLTGQVKVRNLQR